MVSNRAMFTILFAGVSMLSWSFVAISLPKATALQFKNTRMAKMGATNNVQQYSGRFYGVGADIVLNTRTRIVMVTLSGVPLQGTVSGKGWLANDFSESGKVFLESSFEAFLKRRFVSVHGASLDRSAHTATVHAKIPVVGVLTLTLHRIL